MKKTSKKKFRVFPDNSRSNNRKQRKGQDFSVDKIITNKGAVIDTTDEAFSGGIIIDLRKE
jgi:hypothetical protein